MGYDLRIHAKRKLSEAEWRAVVDGDAELRRSEDDYYEYRDGTKTRRASFVYAGKGKDADALVLIGGEVVCKSPCVATIKKMVAIAEQLDAEVVGDDGERYDATGEPVRQQAIAGAKPASAALKKLAGALCCDTGATPKERSAAAKALAEQPLVAVAGAIFDALANQNFGSPHGYFEDAPAVMPFLRNLPTSPSLAALVAKAARSKSILVEMAAKAMQDR